MIRRRLHLSSITNNSMKERHRRDEDPFQRPIPCVRSHRPIQINMVGDGLTRILFNDMNFF